MECTTTTTNYYDVLGLAAPSTGFSKQTLSNAELRRAYKLALLAAHPDKKSISSSSSSKAVNEKNINGGKLRTGAGGREGYTIDQVKTAYMILSNEKSKKEYDTWLLRHSQQLPGSALSGPVGVGERDEVRDFVLGLEVLDLADFDVAEGVVNGEQVVEEAKTEWIRSCRCGADKGFRIREEELEDAEGNGEKEVLVGCEGCSLWVRVGFDVEVEEG